MQRHFTLEYWRDDGWYMGKLPEVPGVCSQGESRDELEGNSRDTDQMRIEEVRIESHLSTDPHAIGALSLMLGNAHDKSDTI